MTADGQWPNLTHQQRDRLHALCTAVGVSPADKWLSEMACEAIERLQRQVAGLADRIAAAHAILARQAERRPALDPAHLYRPCPTCGATLRAPPTLLASVCYPADLGGACPCVRGAVPGWVRADGVLSESAILSESPHVCRNQAGRGLTTAATPGRGCGRE